MLVTASRTKNNAKSNIVLSADDYRGLSALVQSHAASLRMPHLTEQLADELGRAQVIAADDFPQHIVAMNSEVEFRNDNTGFVQRMTLVYPADADIEKGRLSVLTPVGTALIGLRVGDATTWQSPSGQTRKLTVTAVRHAARAQ